ncbi:hypothetical protein R6Q59_000437 [Mikania micrantha]
MTTALIDRLQVGGGKDFTQITGGDDIQPCSKEVAEFRWTVVVFDGSKNVVVVGLAGEDDSAHADVDPQSISTSVGGEVLQALAYDIQIPVYKTKNTIHYLSEHEGPREHEEEQISFSQNRHHYC